jgi:hypothetical protein
MGKEETQIMKRTTRMLILAAVLAVVVIGYTAVSRLITGQDEADVDGGDISVTSHDLMAIEKLEWEYNGEKITLSKEGGRWRYAKDGAFPLDLNKVETMLSAIQEIKASRSIEQIDSLSEYGLEEPGCKITVGTLEGSKFTYHVGDKNEVTGEYYLLTGQSEKVYMVDSGLHNAFSKTLMDMVQRQEIPDLSSAKEIMIETPDSLKKIVYKDTHKGITYTNAYKWFYEFDVEGNIVYSPLGSNKVRRLQSSVSDITWKGCVDYDATNDELANYGLDRPRVVVNVKYSNGDFNLMFGDQVDDNCYAKTGDTGIVYLVSTDVVEELISVDFESLRPDDVCLMEWNTVDSIEIEVDGKALTIYFDRSNEGAVSYIVNGYQGDAEAVENLLDSITGMTSVEQTDKASPFKEPEVRIVFHRNTEFFHTMTLSLFKFNSQSYLVEFDGQSRLLVGNDDVFELKEAFAELADQ